MNSRVFVLVLVCPALLVFVAGCGDSSKATITGKVLLEGKPFIGTLWVQNPEKKTVSSCPLNKIDGSYELRDAPVGKVRFYVKATGLPNMTQEQIHEMMKPEALKELEKGSSEAMKERLLAVNSYKVDSKFTEVETTPLETELKSGRNPSFEIQLTPAEQSKKP